MHSPWRYILGVFFFGILGCFLVIGALRGFIMGPHPNYPHDDHHLTILWFLFCGLLCCFMAYRMWVNSQVRKAMGELVKFEDLVEREGVFYKTFTDIQFSGNVITGRQQGHIKNGKREGFWVEYYESGNVNSKGTYEEGNREGPWITYHDNGQLVSKGEFRNGKQEGFWTQYHQDGTVDEEYTGTYRNGVKVD